MTYLPTSSPALVSAPDDQVRNLAVRTVAPAAAIVLRPGRAAGRGADPTPTRLWPLLVLVLADDAIRADPALTAVFSLLDEERPSAWPAFLEHPADWFVTDGPEPMVELAVHTSAHGGKDAVIALRARVLADVLPLLADKSPVALTTADRATRLQYGVTTRDVLDEVVLVGHLPSPRPPGWMAPGSARVVAQTWAGRRVGRQRGRT